MPEDGATMEAVQPSAFGRSFAEASNAIGDSDEEEAHPGGKRKKAETGAAQRATGGISAERRKDLERQLCTQEALLKTMRGQRLHQGILMVSFKVGPKRSISIACLASDKEYTDKSNLDPSGHGQGCKYPHVAKPAVTAIEKQLDKSEELKAKV
jgi:hypothetical protein